MSETKEQYVVFAVNGSLYAVPVYEVSEIIKVQKVTRIPNSRDEFVGIIHLRNKVIPIISLHKIFATMEKEWNSKTRIIVMQSGGKEIGMVVDEVERVMVLPREQICPTPHLLQIGWMRGVYRQQEKIVALLHLESLIESMNVNDDPV